MINKEPSKVIEEIFEPLRHVESSYVEQLIKTDFGIWIPYDVQHPLLKMLVMERIYSFFLYPPACLCEQKKQKCLCDKKRKETFIEQTLTAYKLNSEALDKLSESTQQSFSAEILSIQKTLELSEQDLFRCRERALEDTRRELTKQCRLLTEIDNDRQLIAKFEELSESKEMNWRTKLNLKTNDKHSNYTIALGIGQHFLSQIYLFKANRLKTKGGRHGFLSLNKVITDVLGKKSLEHFYGIKHPKNKIENAWYQYRSILHLLLGHFSAKAGFLRDNRLDILRSDELDIGILTFISAYSIQQLLIEASLKTFTPNEKEKLFSNKNFAKIPPPDTFVKNYPIVRDALVFNLNPQGIPILFRKDEEKAIRDRWEDRSS